MRSRGGLTMVGEEVYVVLDFRGRGEYWHVLCTDYFRPLHMPNSTLGASPSLVAARVPVYHAVGVTSDEVCS